MSAGTAPRFAPSGFFALRTPLLPFDELSAWSDGLEAVSALRAGDSVDQALTADRARLRRGLATLLGRPEIRDAIFLASPSVDEAIDDWQMRPDDKRGRKAEPVLVSYVTRAAARPTPFGLFAGCTTGTLGPQTRLELAGRDTYRRHSRLDMDYLWALAETLERDPARRRAFLYEPNSSLYAVGDRLRFAQGRVAADRRSYHLVAVDTHQYLTETLDRAGKGATLDALAEALVDDDISLEEAEAFVAELVDNQILVGDVRPGVTGDEPIHTLIATLGRQLDTVAIADRLEQARSALEEIDAKGVGVDPERYRSIAALLAELPARPELSRLVQVDLVKPSGEVSLGPAVVSEISRAVGVLYRLLPPQWDDGLTRFREEFERRYETREVPLMEALDEETGIGFDVSRSTAAEAAPLLAGLRLGIEEDDSVSWNRRDAMILEKLGRALQHGASEISIDASDLEGLDSDRRPPLPDAFHVMASLAARSAKAAETGQFRLLLHHGGGPSGARVLGRFCHADAELCRWIPAHLRAEEDHRPEAVFAEIVHLPEGRIGNILYRPVLRHYEIPYLGSSGAPLDRQIPVTDLCVSVRDGRVVLRSRRLDREVVPRLSTAHNYSARSVGVYRFLCSVQHQSVAGALGWEWGVLAGAPYLPRVVTGKVVLSRARWNLSEAEVRLLRQPGGAEHFAAVQSWRTARGLPRWVALIDDDNELLVDLDNVLSIEAMAHQLRGEQQAALVEMFPPPDELCVSGPEGRFVHELVVPFVRTGSPAATSDADAERPLAVPSSVRRRFTPGSDWLYAKLYGGPATADRVLTEAIAPVVRAAVDSGAADAWFFIRYEDPDPHLRVRFHGAPDRLDGEVRPACEAVAGRLVEAGQVWRVQFDTYEREVERYGGERGIELAEQLFHTDSDAVLAILGQLSGDTGLDARWRLALCGIDRLFDDLGLDLERKRALARESRDAYGLEFRVDGEFRATVGERYRAQRASLEALLTEQHVPALLAPGIEALQARSARIAPLAAELRHLERTGRLGGTITDLAGSYAHMHVNRLLRSAQRAQELVLYEYLDRFYSAQAGRRTVSP